ncbi:hypothetical protein LPC08_23435 [Roseomonas sp. OT10]|uniref:hypothetical protein n=1 Tax=Roseomonas cutis TaxID=2897332 RepID=UPI001E567BFA|nr:hypothetical protein [Roseomonas sp. OT10]UFN48913.1 hypothetical protein LPC08_23435 [Roseomonas sp. OT10]
MTYDSPFLCSANPDIRQREEALKALWPEVVAACRGGVPGRSWIEVRDRLIERLRDHGFKTKAGGMRGAYQAVDQLMKRAIKERGP